MNLTRCLRVITLVAVFGCFAATEYASAQPSIPRSSRSSRSSSSRSSGSVVWGTSYDWLSTRYANYNDIRYLDSGQIRVLRNSIYARHGRRFKDANLRSYFNSQYWYNGWRNEVPMREFNAYEKANISFLKKYE